MARLGSRSWLLAAALVLGWLFVLLELGVALAPRLSAALGLPLDPVPGVGIPALALVDVPLAFTLTLFGLGFVLPHGLLGRSQGCATLLLGIVLLLASLVTVLLAIGLLLVMLALIGSFFGIAVYLALWGDFAREAASAILAVLLLGKLAIGACLILAHPRYLQNRGLVLLWLTSLLANVIVAFLHALVPRPAVSILDAVAAIILAILGIVWAALLLIGAIISIVRVLQPGQRKLRAASMASLTPPSSGATSSPARRERPDSSG